MLCHYEQSLNLGALGLGLGKTLACMMAVCYGSYHGKVGHKFDNCLVDHTSIPQIHILGRVGGSEVHLRRLECQQPSDHYP